jgi:hypothetical protein
VIWAITIILMVPILFVGLLLWYSFVVMADGFVPALLVGMGIGAVVVLGTAMQDGTDAGNAQGLFVFAVVGTLILKAVHVYIEPRLKR